MDLNTVSLFTMTQYLPKIDKRFFVKSEERKSKIDKLLLKLVDFWSEWRDLNPRPHGPEPCALPSALHPDSIIPCHLTIIAQNRAAVN